MKPTRSHYFYAQNWPAWIWFTVVPLLPALLVAIALGTPPDFAAPGSEAKSYYTLIGITWLLGLCVAGLVGWFVLGTLYQARAEINGYPFHAGDRVEILVGANRGRVVRVVEVWDWRGNLRVDLGEFARPGARVHFHFAQVIRADDAGPRA